MPNNLEAQSARYEGNPDTALFEHDTLDMLPVLVFRDGLDQPISKLEVHVDLPDGTTFVTTTDEQGIATPPAISKPTGKAIVKVRGHDKTIQQVCTLELDRCQGSVIIRSPKVIVPVISRPHQSDANMIPSRKGEAWFEQNGALDKAWGWLKNIVHDSNTTPLGSGGTLPHVVKESTNKSGNPIIIAVGPECPNAGNLFLGENNPYRTYILAAAKRINIIPQAVAALIDAEAARKKTVIPTLDATGKPVTDKKSGKPKVRVIKGGWDAESYNAKSRAAGLTQFLESTWLAHVLISGRFICEQSVIKKWVRQEPDSKGHQRFAFVLADGSTTTMPFKHKNDTNVQACLEQRKNPEWSIMAAADYAKVNLDILKKSGFNLSTLNDAEKAKLMYLMHHEGEGAGPLFIRNQLEKLGAGKYASFDERLNAVFVMQVGKSVAENGVSQAGGEVEKAYRIWLSRYIDTHIQTKTFSCKSNLANIKDMSEICRTIGGVSI